MKDTAIDEQVQLLMQGTEYGDANLRRAMTAELRSRLLDCEKEVLEAL